MRRGIRPILREIFTTQRPPVWSPVIAASAVLVASQAFAGTPTIIGSQTVSTSLSALVPEPSSLLPATFAGLLLTTHMRNSKSNCCNVET